MPQDEGSDRTTRSSGSGHSNERYARRRAGHRSSCSTAAGSGTRRRAAGWAGSGSAASSGVQPAAPGRPRHELCRAERRPGELAADPVRDHARRRHADAARHGRPAGRHAGPPAQPARGSTRRRSGSSTGYGVLQPRISFHLTAATHSRFAALLATSGGHRSVFDGRLRRLHGPVRRGSFTGKGIYDVDAFEAATGETFPENHILSHDLIEGNYARCGLLSDTELFDDFPARYHAYARREHRWVRGDWQLLPWLGRRVPTPDGMASQPAAAPGALEAPRQPPPQPCAAGALAAAGPGLDGPAGLALALDGGRPGGLGAAALFSRCSGSVVDSVRGRSLVGL